jgi:hypothetical protein
MKSLMTVAAIGFAMFLSPHLQAQPLTVNLKMTVYTEQNPATNTYTIQKTTIVTKDVLDLVASATGTNFPVDAKLVLINYSDFQVQDAQGNLLRDISDVMTFDFNPYLTAENPYADTGAGQSTYVYISTITYDDGTNNFVFRGYTTEKYSQSARNTQGQRNYKDSIKFKGEGNGTLSGHTVILTGQVAASGTSTE